MRASRLEAVAGGAGAAQNGHRHGNGENESNIPEGPDSLEPRRECQDICYPHFQLHTSIIPFNQYLSVAIGPFSARLSASTAGPMTWTNRSNITAINRASGQLITWTGGIPGSYVSIFGNSVVHRPSPLAHGSPRRVWTWGCSRMAMVAEALECLGGNGYVEKSMMPRLYREAPLNSIWEGSRGLAERIALGLQAALMKKFSAGGDAFIASRIEGRWGRAFGTLPSGIDLHPILQE